MSVFYFSDSESLSPGGDDDLEGTWFSGDEGEDTPMEYGLIDSEIIELVSEHNSTYLNLIFT